MAAATSMLRADRFSARANQVRRRNSCPPRRPLPHAGTEVRRRQAVFLRPDLVFLRAWFKWRERQPSKLTVRVRVPLPAPSNCASLAVRSSMDIRGCSSAGQSVCLPCRRPRVQVPSPAPGNKPRVGERPIPPDCKSGVLPDFARSNRCRVDHVRRCLVSSADRAAGFYPDGRAFESLTRRQALVEKRRPNNPAGPRSVSSHMPLV